MSIVGRGRIWVERDKTRFVNTLSLHYRPLEQQVDETKRREQQREQQREGNERYFELTSVNLRKYGLSVDSDEVERIDPC